MTRKILVSGIIIIFVWLCALCSVVAGELHDAAKAGDIEAVQTLLASGADIEGYDFTGTALHVAIIKGHTAVADALLNAGANIEAEAELKGAHPLHLASEHNRVDIVALLLDRGAKVNARDFEERTPLFVAAANGHVEVAKQLLAHGADLHAVNINGEAALHRAAWYGRLETVQLLLDQGADPDPIAPDGTTPLLQAASNLQGAVFELLVAKGADINHRDTGGRSVMFYIQAGGDASLQDLARRLGFKE